MFKLYTDLTKFGIVIFVLLTGFAGYALGFQHEAGFQSAHLASFLLGLYLLSSGSLALNQAQEWQIDQKMPRTAKRPVASGKIKPAAAAILGISFIVAGLELLSQTTVTAAYVGLVSVLLYNGFYTMWWKKKWVFAAVPGAIPGALPVTIGYAAANPNIWSTESVYLFLVMFFWQMPHFWVLAMKYREDYRLGGIPTLPAALGIKKSLYYIGVYTFGYIALALLSPWMTHASWVYLAVVVPFCFKVLQEFWRFFKSNGEERWFAFFMWTNFSLLIFVFVPVIDKWAFLFFPHN